eukprot:2333951-Amphidinium_carterae.1
MAFRAVKQGHRDPKSRHRDLDETARVVLMPHTQLCWMKAHQTQQAGVEGRVTMENFQGQASDAEAPPLELLAEMLPKPPMEVGPH